MSNSAQKRFRFWLWLIRLIGVIVPRRLRTDWRQEWEAELHHREFLLREWDRLDRGNKLDLLRRSASAFWDAVLLQPRRLEDEMFQDLHYGARMLVRQPSFTAIAVLTLALGIGANITIFSVVNTVLLRPLPYPEAERLVFLWSEVPKQNIKERPSGYDTISDWRQQNKSFEGLAAYDPASVTLTGIEEPEQVQCVHTSAELFSLLGIAPSLGRTFTADEERQKARVAVLSHRLWQSRFAASASVLGQTVEIDGTSLQVIGVMPEKFQFPEKETQLWVPITLAANWEAQRVQRAGGPWRVVGRLRPQASLQQAQLEMNTIARRLEESFPDSNKDLGVSVVPFKVQLTGRDVNLALWILFGAVVCVLLVACTNVANLMLARSIAREREMAIRMAMGAGRIRLIRQLLVESTMLALLSGVAGLLIAVFGIKAVIHFGPSNIPNLDSVTIDAWVLGFTTVVSLLTGVLFGLVPALKISQSHPGEALKDGRSASGGIGGRRLRGLLVITEFGVAVLLLSGAGLLVRSFLHLQAVDPGFNSERVLLINTAPALNSTSDQWQVFYQQIVERVTSLPGVEAASVVKDIVISGNPDGILTIERNSTDGSEQTRIPFNRDVISEDFFRTLHVPLNKGRIFSAQDNQSSQPVTIINETMARRFWPNDDALGKRFKLGSAESANPWLTVVGIVGDMRRQNLEREPIAQIFLPYRQSPSRRMNLLIRTTAEPTQLGPAVRQEYRSLDKTVLVYGITTLEGRLAQSGAQRRFQTWLLTLFSTLALLLAAVGIYGLIHQSVVMRTREIGTRMALGAQKGDVLRLVIGQGMSLALCGVVLGSIAAFGLTQVLTGLLFGVTATDPLTFITSPLLLLLVALLACYLPARRATMVDPMLALRYE